jgi:hypothetical protein
MTTLRERLWFWKPALTLLGFLVFVALASIELVQWSVHG